MDYTQMFYGRTLPEFIHCDYQARLRGPRYKLDRHRVWEPDVLDGIELERYRCARYMVRSYNRHQQSIKKFVGQKNPLTKLKPVL